MANHQTSTQGAQVDAFRKELATIAGVSRATVSATENDTIVELGVRKYEKLLNAPGLTLATSHSHGRPT